MAETDLKKMKLFPRNLTARADAVVAGNPVASRPEDGVENSFPGLELDHRNLDKVFFPGLVIEFHHDFGIAVREVKPGSAAANLVKQADIDRGLLMVAIRGSFASKRLERGAARQTYFLGRPAGLDVWRIIRDVEKGRVMIVLAPSDIYDQLQLGLFGGDDIEALVRQRLQIPDTQDVVDGADAAIDVGQGNRLIVLHGERSTYLTADGVIDPGLVPPGDLTRSLCSPWQFDFAFCGCYFWAGNKPDLVSSDTQPEQILNFQRRDKTKDATIDLATMVDWQQGAWDREANILQQVEMMLQWKDLPVVIGGKETRVYIPPAVAAPSTLLTVPQIVERLRYLATVEHALSVQYLYAFYSLAQPMRPADNPTDTERLVFTASQEVFQVAVDEMRHLRSVNEMLGLLGSGPQLGRAAVIGQDFDGQTGFNHAFNLLPLTPAQLQWFIDVERASQTDTGTGATIDGMYARIQRSLKALPAAALAEDTRLRLEQLVKILIDEGNDHFLRFERAQSALAGLAPATYLKVPGPPVDAPAGSDDRVLQNVADTAYAELLLALDYVFRRGDRQQGALLEAARRAMFNLDDAARVLAARGLGCRFTSPATTSVVGAAALRAAVPAGAPVPAGPPVPAAPPSAREVRMVAVGMLGDDLREKLTGLARSPDAELRALAVRMHRRADDLNATMAAIETGS